ncbi:MAG: FHA domain-containing protein [Thermomicrobiales bacterium]|nr:MAG: FHA domain-containing protein [Thermomicrobiales bacterium]
MNLVNSIPFEWQLLAARILVIALLYLFLLQIARVMLRELSELAQGSSSPSRQPDAPPPAYLVLLEPANASLVAGTTLPLGSPTLLGRHPRCDIVVDDASVSAEHAEIIGADGEWWVRDLGSTNGTFVNGHEVTFPTQVEDGDSLQIGRVKFRVVC